MPTEQEKAWRHQFTVGQEQLEQDRARGQESNIYSAQDMRDAFAHGWHAAKAEYQGAPLMCVYGDCQAIIPTFGYCPLHQQTTEARAAVAAQGAPTSLVREARASSRLDGETHCLPDDLEAVRAAGSKLAAQVRAGYHAAVAEARQAGRELDAFSDMKTRGAPKKPEPVRPPCQYPGCDRGALQQASGPNGDKYYTGCTRHYALLGAKVSEGAPSCTCSAVHFDTHDSGCPRYGTPVPR